MTTRPDIYATLEHHEAIVAELRAEIEAVKAGRITKAWYARNEAAAYLCISTTKLDDLRVAGRLRTHHIDGRPIFHITDLDALAVPESPMRLVS